MENDRSPRPAEPSGGMGGCAIVGILPLIFGIVLVLDGLIGLIGGQVFLGIITIVVGGFIAYWCFVFVVGISAFANDRKDEQKRAIADYDNRSARIAELKRELALLEAKFR